MTNSDRNQDLNNNPKPNQKDTRNQGRLTPVNLSCSEVK